MSREILRETVPSLSLRGGDVSFSSANNSSLVLGRDRDGGVDSGHGDEPGSGAASLVVGRKTGDLSVKDDAATLYLSALSDPDKHAGTTSFGDDQKKRSSAILNADCVRILARRDLKIMVGSATVVLSSDGTVVIDGDVKIGPTAVEKFLKGDTFMAHYIAHTHPVVVAGTAGTASPMTPPPTAASFLSSRFKVSG